MAKNLFVLIILFTVINLKAATVKSPSGNIEVTVEISDQGEPLYSVSLNKEPIILNSRLGLVSDFDNLSTGFHKMDINISEDKRSYNQDKIKKSNIEVNATKAFVYYEGEKEKKLGVEWHVSDNGVAYRLYVPRQKDRGSMVVLEEKNSFVFPKGTTTFLTSQSDPMVGWKRTKPSYEEYYVIDAPMEQISEFSHGYTFPALFKTPDEYWILITETGVDGYYAGSHLSDYNNGYTIALPMKEENNGNGSSSPGLALPGYTPWRVLVIGDNLSPIVETTLPWDLVEPKYETENPAVPGKGTWSWILWQDGSINYDDQIKYIDLAEELGYQNVLVDNWWDKNIGKEGIEELNKYAKSKGINLILWFSSSGHWNDIEQGPINLMDRPIIRKKMMKWMKENGIRAIKVDFFGGDKQETMRLYEDILSDAADYGIQVIFHGCTIPRGWERMYPNFVGAEAVLASENMIFDQKYCDMEAQQATLHPFIRNSVAIMEYGGTFLNKRMNKGNDGGNIRKTTDSFQLATSILFQNPVQNFALAPNNLHDAPKVALDFMKKVPTTWDDVKFIEGYPGKYIVLARKNEGKWWIAGVSNMDKTIELDLELSMLNKDSKIEMIYDNKKGDPVKTEILIKNPEKVKVTLNPLSGFVLMEQ